LNYQTRRSRRPGASPPRKGTSVRALIEEGLRRVLADRRRRRAAFTLRDVSFRGEGLSPEFEGESWPAVRDAIYRERGA
jgi:hypothetical protein